MLEWTEKERKQGAKTSAKVIAEKREEIENLNLKLQRLLDSLLGGIVARDDYVAQKSNLMSRKKTLEEQIAANQKWVHGSSNLSKTG